MRFIIIIAVFILLSPAASVQVQAQGKSKSSLSAADQALLDREFLGVLRGFVWGLPPTIILENEKGTFIGEENGALFYLDYIRGLKSTIGYEFHDNKLWRARIFIEKDYTDMQDRIRDLLVIQEDLTRRYGKPVREDFKWIKDTDKNFPDSWGWAVYRSELFITIVWQNAETEVTAYLGAKNKYDPELTVAYVDRRVKQKFIEDKAKSLLKAP